MASVVSRVISVNPLPHKLEAGVNDVPALVDNQAVLRLNHGIGKELLHTRSSQSAGEPAAKVQCQQARSQIVAVGDPQILSDVPGR